ncbi:MAG: DUF2334 domain-containing protein [Candidatus Bipolaricaulota bacterium]|nr:DUF2334 domain-containing protein [Candidatus Bipolaricaulota bacterium]MCS7274682.1 DUF2334 domain-containing protein [Candidatus Bipolaricaulota bacterium]MDW8111385.1 DUF2334 domain-containing protein [Candidatus Bipolaricaulota bacterium]MDW8329370.1 DUF2334 domain-containing protein [Candidatus Bipolaricaulota bacterium]
MRGTAMPAARSSFIPNANAIVQRWRCLVKAFVGVTLSCTLLPFGTLSQVPLCAFEIWTDSPTYLAGQIVKVYARLQVGEQPIEKARLQVEVRTPNNTNFLISTTGPLSGELNLKSDFRWEGLLMILPSLAGQGLLALTGTYSMIGRLLDPPTGRVYCEERRNFAILSAWGRNPTSKTLLVAPARTPSNELFVNRLAVWLEAAYKTRVHTIYQEGLYLGYRQGDYKDYDVIIYYGVDFYQPPPRVFLEDVLSGEGITRKRVLWIGYHLGALTALSSDLGFAFDEHISSNTPTSLFYLHSQTSYPLLNSERSFVKITDSTLARAHAVIENRPIVVSSKHRADSSEEYFYFVGFHPTAFLTPFGAHLVFLDVLNEIYKINRGKIALVRLEDIHPRSSIPALINVTNYLKSERVPFALALVPFYVNGTQRARLTEESAFRTAVKQALLNGGEVIVHGATHQYDGTTGDDWEFWDEKTNQPIGGAEYAEARVKMALTEIQDAGLAPHTVGWETPHYQASEVHYAVFERYFGLIYEHHPKFDLVHVPYPAETVLSTYVGTPLGYVQNDQDVGRIVSQAQRLAGLKYGAVAAFFYHPFLGVERLRAIIMALKAQGWQFQLVSSLAQPVRVEFPTPGR